MSKTKTALVIACTLISALLSACGGGLEDDDSRSTPSDRNDAVDELLDDSE